MRDVLACLDGECTYSARFAKVGSRRGAHAASVRASERSWPKLGALVPNRLDSEFVFCMKGDGFPQMPAGGLNPEQLDEVESWINAGAPIPQ